MCRSYLDDGGLDGDGEILLTWAIEPYEVAAFDQAGLRAGVSFEPGTVCDDTDKAQANQIPPQGLWHHLDCQGADVWPCWKTRATKNATTGCVYSFGGCPSRLAVATVAEYPIDDDCLRARWQYECLAGILCWKPCRGVGDC